MSTRVKRPKKLHESREVRIARQLEQALFAAGLPNPYGKAQFALYHKRLMADPTYRQGYLTLVALQQRKKAKQ